MDKQFTQALNEMKAELQELYETLDSELRNTDNQALIDDSYHGVTANLEKALNEFDSLIADIDSGIYNDFDGMLEVDEE